MKNLEQLSLREKALLSVLILLITIFLALYLASFCESFLKNHIQQSLSIDESALSLGAQSNLQILKQNENFLQNFKRGNEAYLDEIYKFAKQYKITFKELKSKSGEKSTQNIQQYQVFLKFAAPFFAGISFLNDLEKSTLAFKIVSLNITKNEDLSLNFALLLSFSKLKE